MTNLEEEAHLAKAEAWKADLAVKESRQAQLAQQGTERKPPCNREIYVLSVPDRPILLRDTRKTVKARLRPWRKISKPRSSVCPRLGRERRGRPTSLSRSPARPISPSKVCRRCQHPTVGLCLGPYGGPRGGGGFLCARYPCGARLKRCFDTAAEHRGNTSPLEAWKADLAAKESRQAQLAQQGIACQS